MSTKRKVRIEEVLATTDKGFSPDVWIESDTLKYGETVNIDREWWVVCEVKEVNNDN